MHARERPGVVDVREPGLYEVGAERENDLGVLERVIRDRVAVEREAVRGADRLIRERLQGHPRARAERLHPAVEQPAQAPVLELRHDGDRPALAAGSERTDLVRDDFPSGVPRGALESGAALADQRARDPVGMIEPLERGLATHAERAGVDGMIGVPLELDDATFAIARDDAASGRALAAHGGEPGCDTRHELLVGHHQRQYRLARLLAASGRGRGARHRDDLEEVASVHLRGSPHGHAWRNFIDGSSPHPTRVRVMYTRGFVFSDDMSRSRAGHAGRPLRSAPGGIRRTSPWSEAAAPA